ncbi:acetylxylan esterase [Wenyingzhuangia sp. chi5]|uniref:Acetylxylan esterase n=1 Tax=Wenyingzhuangia gilva TaxID=3057677 RepID=A0ABT8VSW9_9FLAO|nr:acetylxylan esterase [Wenyingzhuangia sp. chi5]MDO3695069.1 acetylxylan esterase [Wenyingzhuangia sp. chi5]
MKKVLLLFICFFITLNNQAQNEPYRSDLLWVTTPNHLDWLYHTNEEASITISVYEYGILQKDIEVAYSYGPELMPSENKGTITLKNGQGLLSIGTMTEPGFKDCQLKLTLNGQEYKHHIKLGFDPEKLRPYTMFPSDFVQFWQNNKQKAYECPVDFTKEFVPEYSNNKVDCYLIKLQTFEKGNYVYGYLTIPKKSGKFPVVFSPPGAGIKPMNPLKHLFYAESGYIRFDMEIHGIRPNLDKETYKEISKAFGDKNNSYLVNGLDDRDNYYMKKVYLSCVRAIDYLTSLKEWDGKNVIAQGGSQGGALALITTGLDKRITACAANHPALSDMAGYKANRAGGYPHLANKFDNMLTPEKINTLSYYDVVNFAKIIDVPVFMTWGYNDNTCPPTTSYIVYNAIHSKKEKLITPINEHWVSTTTRHRILDWISKNLK